jgi:phage repressor protein C with HTH and peptisase S24 domain
VTRVGPGGALVAFSATQVALRKDRFLGLGPRSYCLFVDGDGLRPKFAKGDIVVVDPDRIPKPGDAVVVYEAGKIADYVEYRPALMHVIIGNLRAISEGIDRNG